MAWIDVLLALSPTGAWRLGETSGTAAAAAAGAVAGVYTGSPTLNQTSSLVGDANPSVLFGGSNYVDLGDNFDAAANASYSLLIHAYPTTIDAGYKRLWGKGFYTTDNDRGGIVLAVSTSGLTAIRQSIIAGVGASNELTYATGLTLNAWNYIVVTYDGTNLRIYLNGALVAGPTASAVSLPNFTQVAGIAGSATSGPNFIGRLDEVAWWSGTVLSAANVTALYAAATAPADIQTIAGPFVILNSPDAPSNLAAAAASHTAMNLTWQLNSGDASSVTPEYKLASSGTWTAWSALGGSAVSVQITGLVEGELYDFRVQASNATGASGYSNVAQAATTLRAPTGLALTVLSASSIKADWTDVATVETAYEVWMRTDVTGAVNVSGSLAANAITYTKTGLQPATWHYFTVRAIKGAVASAVTAESIAQTSAAAADTTPAYPFVVEIAFATNPADAPTWTDVTPYVARASWRRGRSTERDTVEAGTCSVTLVDRAHDRRFDPTYAAGAYYPNVRPMRRVRFRALHNAVAYHLFHGYIDGWPQAYPGPLGAEVELTATDAFKVLALTTVAPQDFPSETTGTRVARILDAAGWPVADRNVAAGQSTMPAFTLDDATDAMTLLREAERAENGLLFVSKDGKVTFQARQARQMPPYTTSLVTLGESTGTGEKLYSDLRFAFDDRFIYNEISVEREGGVAQTVSDATSQARYFRRSLSLTGVQIVNDLEAIDAANWLLLRYKEPVLRAEPVAIDPENNDPLVMYAHLFGREISDRMTLTKRPQGVGAAIVQPSYLEAIEASRDIREGSWRATWMFSPADVQQAWLVQDAVYGLAEQTTRAGY